MVALLLGGLLYQIVAFGSIGARGRERAIRRWSRLLLGAAGVRVRIEPMACDPAPCSAPVAGSAASGARQAPPLAPAGSLIVANHVSWLDIFVIDALAPAEFVAKAEIRDWPVIGALVARAGTHFIERHRRHAVRGAIERMAHALRDGRRVAVFPEGAVGDGATLLRFHANLLQAAIEAGAPVVPVALRYLDAAGGASRAVSYVGGTTFVQSLWRIIGEPVTVVRAAVLAPIAPGPAVARHALARYAEQAIGEALQRSPA